MALPPGTSGWIGPDGDCGCGCGFVGGFHYQGNQPDDFTSLPPPICVLLFAVGNFRDGCNSIDPLTADITIEITLNGTPVSEPPVYSSANEAFLWEVWEPEAGDVYAATVTLDCGTTVTIREYEYTIPDPANLACDCCDDRTPDYVVVSGLTGACCDFGNGTFALSDISTCIRSNTVNYSAPATGDRCSDSVACAAITLTTSGYLGGPFDIAYLHKASAQVTVAIGRDPLTGGMLANPDEIRVMVTLSYFTYRKRVQPTLEVTCTLVGGYQSRWIFNSVCSPNLTLLTTDSNMCTTAPSVELAFE